MSGHVLTGTNIGKHIRRLVRQSPTGNGNASVIYRSGTINVQGKASNGIFAGAAIGTAQVTTLPGTTIIVSGTIPGDITPTQSVKAGIDCRIIWAPRRR